MKIAHSSQVTSVPEILGSGNELLDLLCLLGVESWLAFKLITSLKIFQFSSTLPALLELLLYATCRSNFSLGLLFLLKEVSTVWEQVGEEFITYAYQKNGKQILNYLKVASLRTVRAGEEEEGGEEKELKDYFNYFSFATLGISDLVNNFTLIFDWIKRSGRSIVLEDESAEGQEFLSTKYSKLLESIEKHDEVRFFKEFIFLKVGIVVEEHELLNSTLTGLVKAEFRDYVLGAHESEEEKL
jgi:hypothetical protein